MLIGIIGKAGVGKSLLASSIIESDYEIWERMAFADRLKRAVEAMFGLSPHSFDDGSFKRQVSNINFMGASHEPIVCTYGRILQRFGHATREEFGTDIWVDLLFDGITLDRNIIIEDVRFKSEASRIKSKGGVLVRITR